MADFQSQVNQLIDDFVAEITAIARDAAMQTLNAALGAANDILARSGAGAPATIAVTPSAPAAPPPPATGARVAAEDRGKGAKRPTDEIEATKLRLAEFIAHNPGLRIEQINQTLGTTTRDLALPLRKLIAEGVIRTEGVKRSTQYFPTQERPAPTVSPVGPVRRQRA
jgi:hypothetical protein